ncbi:MAG: acyl-CoA dehydrogenase [Deltaproteobacteria bacterium]|nr:acyl-CoA dehydrogenase [Deltaproteobacteria bacterium]
MTTVDHYKPNLRDTFFQLFEVLEIQKTVLGKPPFDTMDEDTARTSLEAFLEVMQSAWAPAFADGDRIGATFDGKGNVKLPPSFHKALDAFYAGGWNKLELPEHLGGYGAPPSVRWSAFEMMAGANPAICFYVLGNQMAKIIDSLGTPAQQQRYVKPMLDEHWGATMVLTEPNAGSDVGAGTTKATHVAGDEYLLEGVKRFITNGDFDHPKNIVHMVLARPDGAGPGTKGLSLFIVPKYWVEEDGSIGARNGAVVTNVEHKMGIKGSATCELTLGDGAPCRGLLVGEVHQGIAQMFHVIEYARMAVGTKSMATLSTAYLNALDYTRIRKQGSDLAKAADKAAPRVEIIRHPDVRRMLMLQKAFAEGLRGMVMWTANLQDRVELAGGHGSPDAKALEALNDLMLPLIKGYGSEKVYDLLAVSLQCFGGSGYCEDYPIEQYIRDQKIDSLYEGTTHIQALDLFFRKIGRDRGATLNALLGQIKATVDGLPTDLGVEKAALQQALADTQGIIGAMLGKLGQSVYHVGFQGNRILFALAELVIGWRLAVGAQVALARISGATGEDKAFYRGKLASARFYAKNVLPGIGHTKQLIEAGDLDLMELPDDSW